MPDSKLNNLLKELGYFKSRNHLFLAQESVPTEHPYAIEMWEMLKKGGDIGARAVFDIEGLPTVAFFEAGTNKQLDKQKLDLIRQQLWNQNLISVVLVIDKDFLTAYSVNQKKDKGQKLSLYEAKKTGWFSAGEIITSEIRQRLPSWFKAETRVDKRLLKNLGEVVSQLQKLGITTQESQTLVGQLLFISYLEHREIISDIYRNKENVGNLHTLISNCDKKGITHLISSLQKDFNGDFLSLATQKKSIWNSLKNNSFNLLNDFLENVDIQTGQTSLWNYDFSKIPVELLSGIYESFLGDKQDILAAYYTPRHLANLTIDQALIDSKGILREVVLDGACGSGILLTTFFRRLLAAAESEANRQLTLSERINLLRKHIFGADVNDAALGVTAFSLYLSLLERLEPKDIAALQESQDVKLPKLRESNLFSGPIAGDFFSEKMLTFIEKK